MVLFGGEDTKGRVFNGTWAWDGTTWTRQFPPTSPPGRSRAAMAYDPATGNVVLFGGFGNGTLDDTWTWGTG